MFTSSRKLTLKRGRVLASLLGGVSLATMLCVFVGIVFWVSLTLRDDLREQLTSRDESVLGMLLSHQIKQKEASTLLFSFEVLAEEDLWTSLLEVASAEGVFAAQLYDEEGTLLRSTSEALKPVAIAEEGLVSAILGDGWTEFSDSVALSEIMDLGYRQDQLIPVQTVYLPLHSSQGEFLGIGRVLIEGSALRSSFELLNQRIVTQALVAGGLGSLLLVLLFFVAWTSLNRAKEAVARQARRLRKANAELAMLARTSALGSVTAHLIHGLRNPLAGVQQAVRGGGLGSEGAAENDELREIREASSRMQGMVDEVVSLLQGAEGGVDDFDLTVSEIADDLKAKFANVSEKGKVRFDWNAAGEGELDSYRARVVMLVATNLIQNAIDASPEDGLVQVTLVGEEKGLEVTVKDEGNGIAADAMEEIFMPKVSAKEGGAGIGLPISSQMARYLKGRLTCRNRDSVGAAFKLFVPWEG
ncbi:HAMP domain-containing histidine kinase [Pelagicoccus sp. NFK12]|uniref:histidine kinase n=1 Tax=Pelagicoccus enzymogenes TaxID=2773457 RepID=A0A927IJN4_9BACT|nr:HAMP domain-containing sensor histidine kinase [Pelagicoccus enzymogenes]MBD5781725.1 HAMP domain-containing histidine kinase [Pelagicoccus enzymogenes]